MKLKPILLETKNTTSSFIIEQCIKNLSDIKEGQLTYTHRLMHSKEYFKCVNIYFIQEDAEIEEGDWILSELCECGGKVDKYLPNSFRYLINKSTKFGKNKNIDWKFLYKNDCKKIVVSTDLLTFRDYKFVDNNSSKGFKGYNKNLPQLSNNSIKLLVDYYNKNNKMPEYIEVKEECINEDEINAEIDYRGHSLITPEIEIKLNSQNQVDIIIPEETNLDIELKAYGIPKSVWEESQIIAKYHDEMMESNDSDKQCNITIDDVNQILYNNRASIMGMEAFKRIQNDFIKLFSKQS